MPGQSPDDILNHCARLIGNGVGTLSCPVGGVANTSPFEVAHGPARALLMGIEGSMQTQTQDIISSI